MTRTGPECAKSWDTRICKTSDHTGLVLANPDGLVERWLAGRVNEWTDLGLDGQWPWWRASDMGLLNRARVLEWLGQFATRALLPGLQYWPTRPAPRVTEDGSWVRPGEWVGFTGQDIPDNASKSVVLARVGKTDG